MLTKAASTISITIPAGAREYEREASFTPSTTRDVMLYELNPHMHYRGKRMRFEALYPNGTSEVLLNVPQYDFNWQSQYRLAQPRRLPAGTVVRVNISMAVIVGLDPPEMVGHHLGAFETPGEERIADHLGRISQLGRGESMETECRLRDSGGNDVHVALSTTVVPDAELGRMKIGRAHV